MHHIKQQYCRFCGNERKIIHERKEGLRVSYL